MNIARKKRRENIAEYLLYLWQLEDLLRALEFSPDKIYSTLVVPHKELDSLSQQQMLDWYMDMVNLLQMEGKSEKGHLEHTEHLIGELEDLHQHLLRAPVGRKYAATFAILAPELTKLGNGGDIELCFRALYSVMLCRLKGVDNEQYIKDVLELISPVIAQLVQIFHKVERGEMDPYEQEK